MGLLGPAAIVIYSDYPKQFREEHSMFHSFEHLPERVETTGFLRGRRCNAIDESSPSAFALYEVSDRAVMVGQEYVGKLNNPTPWTQKFRPLASYASRTLCEVIKTVGRGNGSRIMTVRFSPESARAEELKRWICDVLMPAIAPRESYIAMHFLARDVELERPMTEEERICAAGAGSVESEWILIVEGWSEGALRTLKEREICEVVLTANGANSKISYDFYGLSHLMTHDELAFQS